MIIGSKIDNKRREVSKKKNPKQTTPDKYILIL